MEANEQITQHISQERGHAAGYKLGLEQGQRHAHEQIDKVIQHMQGTRLFANACDGNFDELEQFDSETTGFLNGLRYAQRVIVMHKKK